KKSLPGETERSRFDNSISTLDDAGSSARACKMPAASTEHNKRTVRCRAGCLVDIRAFRIRQADTRFEVRSVPSNSRWCQTNRRGDGAPAYPQGAHSQ